MQTQPPNSTVDDPGVIARAPVRDHLVDSDNYHQSISKLAEKQFSGESTMEKNVGGMDRIARLVVGVVLLVVALAGFADLLTYEIGPITTMIGSAILAVLGLILVVTGALQQCVLNSLLGIDTSQS